MKKPWLISAICVLAAGLAMFFGLREPIAKPEPERIYALVSDGDTGAFLSQLRQGAQSAAGESGAKLVSAQVCASTALEELQKLNRQRVDGVMSYCANDAASDAVQAACAELGIPLTLCARVGNDVSCVTFDERRAGREAAEFVRALAVHGLVLISEQGNATDAARLTGTLSALDGLEITRVAYEPGMVQPEAMLGALAGGAAILCLNESATAEMTEKLRYGAMPRNTAIVGFDTSDACAEHFELGLLRAAVLQAPYAMGYTALNTLRSASTTIDAVSTETVAARLLTSDTLYDAENVKLAFPLLQ